MMVHTCDIGIVFGLGGDIQFSLSRILNLREKVCQEIKLVLFVVLEGWIKHQSVAGLILEALCSHGAVLSVQQV